MLIARFYYADLSMYSLCTDLLINAGFGYISDINKFRVTVLFTETEIQNFVFIKRYTFPIKVETFGK